MTISAYRPRSAYTEERVSGNIFGSYPEAIASSDRGSLFRPPMLLNGSIWPLNLPEAVEQQRRLSD